MLFVGTSIIHPSTEGVFLLCNILDLLIYSFEKEVPKNPLKAEYLIPTFIGELLEQNKMSVKVLKTDDTWYGMTYKEDVAAVKESFKNMLENGLYQKDLFSDL